MHRLAPIPAGQHGVITARLRYDPYGNTLSKTGTSDTSWRYASAWFDRHPSPNPDAQHGLYKMGERYYDPAIARWTQRDPLNTSTDLRQGNRHGYVGGDPINNLDATGLHGDFVGGSYG